MWPMLHQLSIPDCWALELKDELLLVYWTQSRISKEGKKVIITGNMSCDMELKYIFKIFNAEIFRTMSNLELGAYTM